MEAVYEDGNSEEEKIIQMYQDEQDLKLNSAIPNSVAGAARIKVKDDDVEGLLKKLNGSN